MPGSIRRAPAVRFRPRAPDRESPDTRSWRHDEPARRESSFSDVSARLDALARQVDHLSSRQRVPHAGHASRRSAATIRACDRRRAGAARPQDRSPGGRWGARRRSTTRRRPRRGSRRPRPARTSRSTRRWPRSKRASACSTAEAPPPRRWTLPRAPTQQLARPRAAAPPDQRPHRHHAALRHRRRGRDPARRSRRDRRDAQGSDAAAGDRGAGNRSPLAGVAHRQRAPCRRRWRRRWRASSAASPKSATRCTR